MVVSMRTRDWGAAWSTLRSRSPKRPANRNADGTSSPRNTASGGDRGSTGGQDLQALGGRPERDVDGRPTHRRRHTGPDPGLSRRQRVAGDHGRVLALTGAALVGAAVLVSLAWVQLSVVLLGIATLALPASAPFGSVGWNSAAGVALLSGVSWVAANLGSRLPLRSSAGWLTGLALVSLCGSDTGLPILMVSIGWWLVGRAFRHRQQTTDRLQARADELATEQVRSAAEAVRLERARIARSRHGRDSSLPPPKPRGPTTCSARSSVRSRRQRLTWTRWSRSRTLTVPAH